jgi:hemerythrin
MAIDEGVIDEDHRHLIDIVNSFAERAERFGSVAEALELLLDLRFHAKAHFEREERLQLLAGCPFCAAHKKEHVDLVRRLDSIMRLAEHATLADLDELSREVADLLHAWLVDHLLQSDLAMKPYVEEMRRHAGELPPLRHLRS